MRFGQPFERRFSVKQTTSLNLKLPLKPVFCSVFLVFMERKAFACFKPIYF